jgi:hypothetical protein
LNATRDIQYIGLAFSLMYFIYMMIVFIYSNRRFKVTFSKKISGLWFAGLSLIVGISAINWNAQNIVVSQLFWSIIPLSAIIFFAFEKQERVAIWQYLQNYLSSSFRSP